LKDHTEETFRKAILVKRQVGGCGDGGDGGDDDDDDDGTCPVLAVEVGLRHLFWCKESNQGLTFSAFRGRPSPRDRSSPSAPARR
jgi:hypothetical protein